MALKICKGCNKTFRPQLTHDALMALYYEEEHIEKMDFIRNEHPYANIPPLVVPEQYLCDKCTTDPDIEVSMGFGGRITVRRKQKSDSAHKAVRLVFGKDGKSKKK